MAKVSLNIEELRKAVGKKSPPVVVEVEKGAIRKFAEAVGDPNPLWQDEAKARKSRYGGIIATPTFYRSVITERPGGELKIPLSRLLDGGSDWEFYEPVRAGDTITAVTRLADILQREGRLGPMLFVIHETTYRNQFRRLTAKQRTTTIHY